MKTPVVISVTELKSRLLEVMRSVMSGKEYQVTKADKPIAIIYPYQRSTQPRVGFADVVVCGDIISPIDEEWDLDSSNIK
jgi:prevent-host-death family protein